MTALYCYSVITVGTGCIPFFKVGGNGGRGRIKPPVVMMSQFKRSKVTSLQVWVERHFFYLKPLEGWSGQAGAHGQEVFNSSKFLLRIWPWKVTQEKNRNCNEQALGGIDIKASKISPVSCFIGSQETEPPYLGLFHSGTRTSKHQHYKINADPVLWIKNPSFPLKA